MPFEKPPPLPAPVPFGQLRPRRQNTRHTFNSIVLALLGVIAASLILIWEQNISAPPQDPWIAASQAELLAQEREPTLEQRRVHVLADAQNARQ